MMDIDKFLSSLKLAEGWAPDVYLDTIANPPVLTIGYGHALARVIIPAGCSIRLIPINPITASVGEILLSTQALEAIARLRSAFPAWDRLDAVRQEVIADMAFNMGPAFIKTWPIFARQVSSGDYAAAARNMESTRWYRQVGRRSKRLTYMMRYGTDPGPLKVRSIFKRRYSK